MTNPVNDFSMVTVSCFDVSLRALRQGISEVMRAHNMNVLLAMTPLDYAQYGPEPLRGKGAAKAGFWEHAERDVAESFMVSNLADGWLTLATATSLQLGCRCWRFTVSDEREQFPRNAFSLIQAGSDLRVVSAQRDDPSWVFYEDGQPLSVEEESAYKRRRIRDRVSREYVISLAEKAGFPIGQDAFWVAGQSFSLSEVR
jgi:hypothetical protein